MLTMVATGTMRILKKVDGGEDKNGNAWAHFAAISCEEVVDDVKTSDFYILKAFGNMAEYIERNLNGPRRATVSGELVVENYVKDVVMKKDVEIEGEVYEIEFTTQVEAQTTYIHNVSVCKFLDKKREDKEETPKEETLTVTKK